MLLQLMYVVTCLLAHLFGVGQCLGLLDLLLQASSSQAKRVLRSLGKSISIACRSFLSLNLESWRWWVTDVGSGPSLWIPLILADSITSLLSSQPPFLSDRLPYWLQASSPNTKSTASVYGLTESHNWVEPKPYNKSFSIYLFLSGSASLNADSFISQRA